tara:strand:+ start:1066 stop:1602 length:537 start_codon:yes stop_codon:yes gene_type:complete
MSTLSVDKVEPVGSTLTFGESGDAFVIPSGATFTNNGTATGFAGGLILKVYEHNLNTTVSTASTSYVASGLTVTTDAPASTSSRFLLTLLGGTQLGTINYGFVDTTFYVGGVEVADTGPYEKYMYYSSLQDPHSAQMIHSPGSVLAQTYAVFYKTTAGTGSFNVSPARVVFTVMELSS